MTSETYFRIQTADRDVNELLDPGYQFSHAYNRAAGNTRRGISTCTSLEELAEYLASHLCTAIQPRNGSWVLVELEGEISSDDPVDTEYETLVIPTAIVSVRPVDDDFLAMIDAAAEFLASFDTDLED